MKLNNNQVILVIFMVIMFLCLNKKFMEPFANKNRKRKDKKSKRKNLKNKKNKKGKSKKEDFINIGITNLFKGFMSHNEEDKKKDKKVTKINKREHERHDMINNKPSKNTTDSMHKFSALKQGLYDIVDMGNMMSS